MSYLRTILPNFQRVGKIEGSSYCERVRIKDMPNSNRKIRGRSLVVPMIRAFIKQHDLDQQVKVQRYDNSHETTS